MVMPLAYEPPIPEARFTGIFIPVEVLEMEELSLFEMILLSWVDAFTSKKYKGCFASNSHLAERLHVEPNTVAKALTRLRSLDLIEDVSFNGRTRVIRSKVNQKIYEIHSQAGLDKNPSGLDKNPSPLDKNPSPSLYIESKDKNKDKKSQITPLPTQHNIKGKTSVSSLAVGLATFLFSKLQEINPKKKSPNLQSWAKDLDYMMRIDNRSEDDIKKVIEFIVEQHKTTPSGFTWSAAVQSADKLREHFDAIWLQLSKPNPKKMEQENNKKKIDIALANKLWMQKIHKILGSRNADKESLIKVSDTGVTLKAARGYIPLGYTDSGFADQISNFLRMNGLWSADLQFKGGQDE